MILRIGHFFASSGERTVSMRPLVESMAADIENLPEPAENPSVIAGSDNICFAAASGKLFQFGAGFYEETLPITSKSTETTGVTIDTDGKPTLSGVIWRHGAVRSIGMGCGFVAATCEDGSLYSWGYNRYQRLGRGSCGTSGCGACVAEASAGGTRDVVIDASIVALPTKVPFPVARGKLRTVVCGRDHMLALAGDGRVYACGRNSFGQLGVASSCQFTCSLQQCEFPTEVVVQFIAAGACTSVGCPEIKLYVFS